MELNDFYLLFRRRGCEKCKCGSERTFARRLILGRAQVSDFCGMNDTRKRKIENALKEGVTCARAPHAPGSGTIILRPCKAKGKTMGEIRLRNENKMFPLFDSRALFGFLVEESGLKNISYSEELGFIRASMGEKNIFIFENGLIRVKQAESREDIEKTIAFLKKLIERAKICDVCGGTKEECESKYCGKGRKLPNQ